MMDRDMKRGMLNLISRLIMVSGMKTANALLVFSAINGEKEMENREMNDAIDTIVKTCQKWDEGKSIELARTLQMQFSILRMFIGFGFDELNAFVRIEREAKEFIDETERKVEAK